MEWKLLAPLAAIALVSCPRDARAEDAPKSSVVIGGDYDNGLLLASLPLATRAFVAEGRTGGGGPLHSFALRGSDVGLYRPTFYAYTTSIHYFKGPLFLGGFFSIGGGAHDGAFPQSGPGVNGDPRSVSYIDGGGEIGLQLVRGGFYGRATTLVGLRRIAFDVSGCDCGSAVYASALVQPRLHVAYALAGGDPASGPSLSTSDHDASVTFLVGAFVGADVCPLFGANFGVTLTFRGAGTK